MKVNIISKEQNPLLKRTEITFSVDHAKNGGTPTRVDVIKQLASLLKAKHELIYVKNLNTKTGTMTALGEANVYTTDEQAKLVEPKHIIARNTVPDKPEEESQPTEEKTEKPDQEEE